MTRIFAVLAIVLFVLGGQAVNAQNNNPVTATPNILGVWNLVAVDGIFGDQVIAELPHTEIVIDMQQGAVFSGSLGYEVAESEPAFHDGSDHTRMASEPFLGVIGWDGRTLTIAEREDTSMLTGELLNSETMSLIYVEPGEHAFAARMLLVRQ